MVSEEIRTINRAIAHLDHRQQDLREEARTALHHVEKKLAKLLGREVVWSEMETKYAEALAELTRLREENYALTLTIDALKDDLANSTPNGELARVREVADRYREEREQWFAAHNKLTVIIADLNAELTRLRGEIQDMVNEHNGGWVPRMEYDRLREDRDLGKRMFDDLELERDTYRAALERIVEANVSHSHKEPCWENCPGYETCDSDAHDWHTHIGGGDIARQALEGSE